MAKFIVRGQIDGVIQRGAARTSRRTWDRALRANRATRATHSACVDLRFIEGMAEAAYRICKILQQRDVNIETNYKRLIILAQSTFEKRSSDFLFHIEHALLAAAGVDEHAQSQRQIRLRFEIFNYLRLTILFQVKVSLVQVRDQCAVLVFDVEE